MTPVIFKARCKLISIGHKAIAEDEAVFGGHQSDPYFITEDVKKSFNHVLS